jgi:hypothetical protein
MYRIASPGVEGAGLGLGLVLIRLGVGVAARLMPIEVLFTSEPGVAREERGQKHDNGKNGFHLHETSHL